MTTDYDAIIVGARVTGSLLAILLGTRGHRVLLLDRARFPSDTLSTHFFRAPAFRAFYEAGVYDDIQTTAPHLIVNHNVVDGMVFPEPVDRPDDYPFYLCLRRFTLDDILVRRARTTPTIELREGARANALLREDGRIAGVTWQEAAGSGSARAKAVIGADGIYSFVAKEVDATAERSEPINRAMYYAYYRGIPPMEGPAAEFHYRGNHLAYCFPTDDDLTLVALSVPIAEFGDFRNAPEVRFRQGLERMIDLAPRLDRAERQGPVRGTGSIPGYMRVPYGHGWVLVGDAGMTMDPWSGQGIDHGSTHAVMLARALSDFLEGAQEWDTAMSTYHARRNAFSQTAYHRTCLFSRDVRPMTRAALEKRGLAGVPPA
jgi:2-polyprenyl-6-methoxyphenol hydroxylase-like FAD-dependent oxidoreductase